MNRKHLWSRIAIPLACAVALSALVTACAPAAPPTPTPMPTPTTVPTPDLKSPIQVAGAQLLLVIATNDPTAYDSGPFTVQLDDPSTTLLHVEAKVVSGDVDLGTLGKGISLTDENDKKCPLVSFGTEEPMWEFVAPKASKSFTLHFPGGPDLKLDSILKMLP